MSKQKQILGDVATFLYTALYSMGGMENGFETYTEYADGKVVGLMLPHNRLPDSRKECIALQNIIADGLKVIEANYKIKLCIRPKHVEYGCYRHTLTATIMSRDVTPYDGIDGVVRAPRPAQLDKAV